MWNHSNGADKSADKGFISDLTVRNGSVRHQLATESTEFQKNLKVSMVESFLTAIRRTINADDTIDGEAGESNQHPLCHQYRRTCKNYRQWEM